MPNPTAGIIDKHHQRHAFYVDQAVAAGAGSRSVLYEAMRASLLKAKKQGRRTIILREDLEAYLKSLPDYAPKVA